MFKFLDSTRLRKNNKTSKSEDESPLRAEVFSLEHLQAHAKRLSDTHEIETEKVKGFDLLARLKDNKKELINVYQTLTDISHPIQSSTPSAEWLMDNFHIVEEQLREVEQDLPPKYYKELPKLKKGEYANYPRVYHLAIEIVKHTDNRLEMPALKAFIESYQEQNPLSIGELWAFPISLRLSLIENLRRFAIQTLQVAQDFEAANEFANTLQKLADKEFSVKSFELLSETFDKERITTKFSDAFLVQLATRLRGQGDDIPSFALEKLEHRLRPEGETIEHLAHREHNRQAAAQVSVANIITSMRLLSVFDWQDFFESVSLVDQILVKDPANAYKQMDFGTRDHYRNNIERISKRTKTDEREVARKAVELAEEASKDSDDKDKRQTHVGYFLYTDKGLIKLEKSFKYRQTIRERLRRFLHRYPTAFYLSGIASLTFILVSAFFFLAPFRNGLFSLSRFLIVLLVLIPASELAITLINRFVNAVFNPQQLPKMDYEKGIPSTARTLVVIPTLLTDPRTIEDLCSNLEIFHLANRDKELYFALLGDLKDADKETVESDKDFCRVARQQIAELNKKHQTEESQPRFLFFTRKREWNEGENKWICRERKRGNLHEFNQLIRGNEETSFDLSSQIDLEFLKTIRYIITLDADTQLPRDTARKLVGTIEHPLNRPFYDEKAERVTKGYAILQPRIEINLTSAMRSRFARLYSACKGFDPYTTAVSDVYQDLFGQGSYVGKGLYDVDAFEAALDKRIPANKLLSHDLFEGLYARVALLTDTVLYDDYPSSYESYAKRLHRWTRGDWQIARWLLPFVPDADGNTVRNRLPIIARWKIFDNLRRSLIAPAILLWLITAWFFTPLSAFAATIFALVVLTAPLYIHIASTSVAAVENAEKMTFSIYLSNLWSDLKTSLVQMFLRLTFLVNEALMSLDAILRVVYRKFISRKKLLEWVTAAQSDRSSKRSFSRYLRFMFASPVIAIVVFACLIPYHQRNLPVAISFLILWTIAPFIAFQLSKLRVVTESKLELEKEEINWLRIVARRTWRYFETYVGEREHWLPPDNFQQDPFPVIAHRTSPTNIGLLFLSTLAARDFGYTGTLETIERIELTCMTLERLERYNGHFYNWYDTRSLEPLHPQYISTVDSGNLAGHLIAVAQGCRELTSLSLFDNKTINGFSDTLACMKTEIEQLEKKSPQENIDWLKQIKPIVTECIIEVSQPQPEGNGDWKKLFEFLTQKGKEIRAILSKFSHLQRTEGFSDISFWVNSLVNLAKNYNRDLHTLFLSDGSKESREKLEIARENFRKRVESVADFCRKLADEMDFAFLYDNERKVLTIGYRPAEGVRDESFYDLFASEARLASFMAIASGDVEQEHWFRLGRGLVKTNGSRALISWTGTMFEYLMPLLVMKNYENTLFDETYRAIINKQIKYGLQHNLAWGVSESAYNARDLQLNYQYGPFGVPGLGLKRGLSEDFVVSPYSTAIALPLSPVSSTNNLKRLAHEGMFSQYGFFEAVDYTKNRLPPEQNFARIEAYMSHHQGMIFVALDNFLNDDVMVQRFHREPLIESAELLLQERVPHLSKEGKLPRATDVLANRPAEALVAPVPRRYTSPNQTSPHVCFLSNGKYTVMLTAAGSGFSTCEGKAVNRWREDVTCDNYGSFIYLHDVRSDAIWSSGFQPTLRESRDYEVVFSENKADFLRRDVGIHTHTEVIVSTEDNAELRRVTLTNESKRVREVQVSSYQEIVLNDQNADEAHPAFSNLFVETDFSESNQTLLAHRRPRSTEESEKSSWAAHTIAVKGETLGEIEYETDRAKFLGRGNTTQKPSVITYNKPLSGTVGATLDPIFSLQTKVRIQPGESAVVMFTTMVADTKKDALELVDKYRETQIFEREENLAWTRSQVELRHLGITTDEANLYQRLAEHLVYTNPTMRPSKEILEQNKGMQKDLWQYGISGDLPIMIVRITQSQDTHHSVRQVLRAHEYLRTKNLIFDLVILNDQPTSYAESFNEDVQALIRADGLQTQINTSGGLFLLQVDTMSEEDLITLDSAAQVCFLPDRGSLEDQLVWQGKEEKLPPPFIPEKSLQRYSEKEDIPIELELANDLGGFTKDGSEYCITLEGEESTPAPWSNIISNQRNFGFLATESGMGVTWSENSRENRLTNWSNDAVSNQPTECIYLRDEETGSFWTPTALPIREKLPYTTKHGNGYTIFEHTNHGIKQELLVFAPINETIKISRLRVKNLSDHTRKLSATYFTELVMGVNRSQSAPFIITDIDANTGAIIAHNPHNDDFSERVLFVATNAEKRTWTCNRKEFIGRNGNLARPAAMLQTHLSGTHGAGLDPCAALQTEFEIAAGDTHEIIFLLGEEANIEYSRHLINKFRSIAEVTDEFKRVVKFWNETTNAIEVKTPNESMNLILNRWLVYQTLACRLWARTAFYQSSGAFGFRDQLQDVMALVYTRPDLTRKQILHAASHQFKEGDVLHWWHEPSNKGTRTKFSDDLLWLVFVTCFYIEKTGDADILNEDIPFIEAPLLAEDEMEVYLQTVAWSEESGTLYEHCIRAIERSLRLGERGLPLIGAGDWNDGMNSIGDEGKGESVWMGWFLAKILEDFAEICVDRDESERATKYRKHAKLLKKSINANAWDGDWYLRAFFDDGTPLGSKQNEECMIDSLAQSWSVISGMSNKKRSQKAMRSVEKYLIKEDDKMALLLTPAFDKSNLEPGYIKAYTPGIRENGAQYTHAATWAIIAFALLGKGEKAENLFSLLNPINHTLNSTDIETYKTEPYVVAADVYSNPQHTGRGGWTWYTGAASWMYRAAIEYILGFKKQGDTLLIEPCIPNDWQKFEIIYRHQKTKYHIKVENPQKVCGDVVSVTLDGENLEDNGIPLVDDEAEHFVRIILGESEDKTKAAKKAIKQ